MYTRPMTKNPYLNALAAALYIVALASAFFALSHLMPHDPHPILAVTAFLSVFVLSASLMGYFIVLAPLQLFLEGQKKEAVALFLKTVLAFACIVLAVFVAGIFLLPAPPPGA